MTQKRLEPQIVAGHTPTPLRWVLMAAAAGCIAASNLQAADIGTAFTYQGSLQNAGGPVTAACDFRFRLYDDDTGSTEVAPSQTKTVAVSGGLFTVPDLDFGAGAFDGSARWMAIEVCCPSACAPQPLAPRVELTPSPHALRAAGLALPYADTISHASPMLELTQTGDGPAATFDVGPNHLVGVPAVQVTNRGLGSAAILEKVGAVDYFHPTMEVRSDTGGPAAKVWVQPQPEPPLPVAALEVVNDTDGPAATFGIDPRFTPAAAILVTNSGLGSAIEAVSGHVGPPCIKATNVSAGPGLEVSSGELSVSSAPTLRTTNIGIGTAAYVSATNGTALHAVSANGSAGYFEGGVVATAGISCVSLAWADSSLGPDQGGAIELGNSLTTGNSPYIDFHRGVGLAQDYNVRLQNDADGELKVSGNLATTGGLTVAGDLSVEATVSVTGDLTIEQELTVTGELTVESDIKKAYTTGTSNRAAPIAYAVVDGTTGLVVAGTPNVSSSWDSTNQRFLITITGETYSTTTHVTTVTPAVGGAPEALFATTGSGSGQLRVRIMSSSTGTTGLPRSFSCIVYKP